MKELVKKFRLLVLVLGVVVVGLIGVSFMGMNSTGSVQPVWNDPAVSFKAFEIWVSTLAPTQLSVAGYNGYKNIRIFNPSTSAHIFVGGSDVQTSSGTVPADLAKTGYAIGPSTSTYHTLTINTALPVYAIGSANQTSSSTVHVMLSGWDY